MGRKVGERLGREGTRVYLWLILVDVWQKTTKFCKTIILQLENKLIKKETVKVDKFGDMEIQTFRQTQKYHKNPQATKQMKKYLRQLQLTKD